MESKRKLIIGLSGRFGSGKDYVANTVGATPHSLAEPLYALCRAYLGTDDKSKPGVRRFLQCAGQWMRGTVDADYPWTTERSLFMGALESGALLGRVAQIAGIDPWVGRPLPYDSVFIDALCRKLDTAEGVLHAVTNVRFENEVAMLRKWAAAGGHTFLHVFVLVGATTLADRRQKAGYAAADDHGVSEAYARQFSDAGFSGGYFPSWLPDTVVFNDKDCTFPDVLRFSANHVVWVLLPSGFRAHLEGIVAGWEAAKS